MTRPSGKIITLLIVLITVVIIAGLAIFVSDKNQDVTSDKSQASFDASDDSNDSASSTFIKIAMKERSLGSASAPIVIEDYSSLTCPHCAQFHTEILPKLKVSHIDTGKVRLVYKDFPLNLPALQASSISRCIQSDDAYFAYLDQLFSTQEEWAFETNAKDKLLSEVGMTGMSRDQALSCLNSGTITKHILTAQNDAKNKFNIDSTPYFIINDGQGKIRGVRTYDMFIAELDKIMASE